jgi:two-component system invasion response regulator UvrY
MPAAAPSLKIGLVDDHKLFRKGLISLIELVDKNYTIAFEADDGIDLQQKINSENEPDIVIMDVSMPRMNGFDSVRWLTKEHPGVKVLVISMIEKEDTIVEMLKLGVKGYLCKDVEPKELGEALIAIANKGFYYTDFITGKLVHSLQADENQQTIQGRKAMNDRERQFLQLACSEMTYQEIADKMFLSPKTIDGYRNSLFEKLNAKSRVGLVLFAVKNGLITLE